MRAEVPARRIVMRARASRSARNKGCGAPDARIRRVLVFVTRRWLDLPPRRACVRR